MLPVQLVALHCAIELSGNINEGHPRAHERVDALAWMEKRGLVKRTAPCQVELTNEGVGWLQLIAKQIT
jgi:hypothetical protein